MGERSAYRPGTFCWVELLTPEPEAAKEFYGGLFGWEHEDMPVGEGGTYTMLRGDGKDVAALHRQPDEQRQAGAPPAWGSYVSIEDVDATAARVKELGGSVMAGPFDVMDAGRMAFVQDPHGAALGLWQPGRHFGAALVNTHGSFTLNQLNTSDPDAAGRFYSDLFGWSVELQGEDSGQSYWGIFNDGALNGGMMQLPESPAAGPPHWLVYFGSEDLGASTKRVKELGGQVVVPPVVIPSGGRFAVAQDPHGAFFAMFEGRFDD